jgi:hypothetical protein
MNNSTGIAVRPLVLIDELKNAILDGLRTDFPQVDRLYIDRPLALAVAPDGQEYLIRTTGRCTAFDRYMYWEFGYSGPSGNPGQRLAGLFNLKILPGQISHLLGDPIDLADWVNVFTTVDQSDYQHTLQILKGA